MKKNKQDPEQTEEDKIIQHKEDTDRDYSEQQRRERREAELENEQPNWNIN